MRRTANRPLPAGAALAGRGRRIRRGAERRRAGVLACDGADRRSRCAAAHARHLRSGLHAAQDRDSVEHGDRRGARRTAAGNRLVCSPRVGWRGSGGGCSSRYCSSGNSRTSWPSRGCTARTTLPAGLRMVPGVDPTGRRTAAVMILTAAVLVPVGVVAAFGVGGWFVCAGAAFAGSTFCGDRIGFGHERTDRQARRVLRASLVYLPCVFASASDRRSRDQVTCATFCPILVRWSLTGCGAGRPAGHRIRTPTDPTSITPSARSRSPSAAGGPSPTRTCAARCGSPRSSSRAAAVRAPT